jgi:hypothetical protein
MMPSSVRSFDTTALSSFRPCSTLTSSKPCPRRSKRLLLRFERMQQRHYEMKLLAYTLSKATGAVPETRNQFIRQLVR